MKSIKNVLKELKVGVVL